MKLIYAGIGSRETPLIVLKQMYSVAQQLAPHWTLRSGHADGADTAFEEGCIMAGGNMEIMLPWIGFNNAPNKDQYHVPNMTQELLDFASAFHPAWDKCSSGAKRMHARNACQILGLYGDEPVDMVICWTKDGKRGGGTGQALRIAEYFNIPIFDLAVASAPKQLCQFVDSKMTKAA